MAPPAPLAEPRLPLPRSRAVEGDGIDALLQQLRDVQAPPDPNWWPPAPGWWLLALLCVVAAVWLTRFCLRNWCLRAPYRGAKRELDAALTAAQSGGDAQVFAHEAAALLRRLARLHPDSERFATDANNAWLHQIASSPDDAATLQQALGTERFRPAHSVDVLALAAATQRAIDRLRAANLRPFVGQRPRHATGAPV